MILHCDIGSVSADCYSDIHEHISKIMHNQNEAFLRKIIQKCTGDMDYTAAEALNFSFVTHEKYPGRKWISYKGDIVGELVMITEYKNDRYMFECQFRSCNKIE